MTKYFDGGPDKDSLIPDGQGGYKWGSRVGRMAVCNKGNIGMILEERHGTCYGIGLWNEEWQSISPKLLSPKTQEMLEFLLQVGAKYYENL
jgi:hypothetical protein